jgi:hypothetical protein
MKRTSIALFCAAILASGLFPGCVTSVTVATTGPETDATPPDTTPPATKADASIPAPTDLVLLPAPRRLTRTRSDLKVNAPCFDQMAAEGVPRPMMNTLCGALAPFWRDKEALPKCNFWLRAKVDPQAMPHAEGYLLRIDPEGIDVTAHDYSGIFYAAMTLKQLTRQCAASGVLPGLEIEDWPDFPNRGVMLDVARDKVPEMETLYALVDKLAEWKCNQLQLYTEHTFAYRNHPVVWQDASPMTAVQIRALDAYCKDRFIELVPNQNSFGHVDRWLKHDEYKGLGEMPGGGSDLCPVDPGSIALLADMYADMLPNFSSAQCNVGCDETWSLGKGRSKDACEKLGVGLVYLSFLVQIHSILQRQGRAMQFWGDIIMQHPELIPELPPGIIAMEWGYEANHPFASHGKKFAESKIPFYVVPGTSTWNSLVGRTDNAVANLRNAAENGAANGSIGYLITDWGDGGHWQFLPASYLGFAYGAAVSWACETNRDASITRALDVHAFEDSPGVMGKLAYDLGNAYQVCGVTPGNSSIFYTLLSHGLETPLDSHLTVDGLQKTIAYIDGVMAELPKAQMKCTDAALIAKEFESSAAFMRLACRIGIARLEAGAVATSKVPALARHQLAAELQPLIPEFRQLWLARNRSGGLKDSAGRFENLLAILQAP